MRFANNEQQTAISRCYVVYELHYVCIIESQDNKIVLLVPQKYP